MRNKPILVIGLLILLWGSASGVWSQTRQTQTDKIFLSQRVANLETTSDKSEVTNKQIAKDVADLTNRIVRLESRLEDLKDSVDSNWNLQLSIAGGVALIFVEGLISRRKKE